MTHESTASITRERKRRNKKKKVGEKERQRFCFGLAHLFYLFIYLFWLMKVYLFHLDVASAHWFILHVNYYFISCWFFCFLRKFQWFVLTKMEILFWFSSFILSLNCNLFTDQHVLQNQYSYNKTKTSILWWDQK